MPADIDVRAEGWRALAALHGAIETALERALRAHGLSVVEFTVLDVLSRQDGFLLRMHQVASATALSQSATTRPSSPSWRPWWRRCSACP